MTDNPEGRRPDDRRQAGLEEPVAPGTPIRRGEDESRVRAAIRTELEIDAPTHTQEIKAVAKREAALHMRRAHLTPAEYEARYRGLDHLYFERAWFRRELEVLGAARIEIRDQNIAGYANSAHRFNVVAWR